jgi:hypothetical protein
MKRCWLSMVVLALAVLLVPGIVSGHETKEAAGLEVVFGAEPEPALTGELQFLRWRFRAKEGKQPFGDLEELRAVVKRAGKDHGPFDARMSRRDAGLAQTTHIFTEPGEYEAVLTFKKKGETRVHAIAFAFRIRDRKELELPK